jgi:hypothetical protein
MYREKQKWELGVGRKRESDYVWRERESEVKRKRKEGITFV